MELDGYCESLALAFEHQGQQHFQEIKFFKRDDDQLARRMADDERKRMLCKQNGVRLVEIPAIPSELPLKDVKDYIRVNLLAGPISAELLLLMSNFTSVEVNYKKAYRPDLLSRIRDAANAFGGEVLSNHYLGIFETLRFRCAAGHEFERKPVEVIHHQLWCPYCARKRRVERAIRSRKSIVDLQRLAAKRGGRLLSSESLGAHQRHSWVCSIGHQFDATPANVLMGKWCPACAQMRTNKRVREDSANRFSEIVRNRGGCIVDGEYI